MNRDAPLFAGLALLAASSGVLAHPDNVPPPKITVPASSRAVPFELFRGNRIIVPVKINGRETSAFLDSGASTTTLDRAYARSIGLPEGRKIEAEGAGGIAEAELVSGVTLEIGGMRFDDMNVGVVDLAMISRAVGRPVSVVVGREFFNSAVVSIDWARGRLHVSPHEGFKPDASAVAVPLTRRGPFNTIPVSIANAKPVEALLDLGNGGALSVPRTYWGGRSDLSGLRFAQWQAGGVGGLHAARSTLVPEVTLAGRTFAQVPAVLSDFGNDHDPTQMTNVGIDLLKQFHVDLDLGRDRIYLTPRSDAPPFDRDRSGTRMDLVGDRLKVKFVSPQGPAAAAGLKEGDEIVAIDGQRVTADYYAGRDWTRGPAGKAVTLERADRSRVTVTLSDYY